MSMNFSEFKKLMGADPRTGSPRLSRARQSAPEFEAAAQEAEAFEEKLQSALLVQPPADLLSRIKAISQQPASETKLDAAGDGGQFNHGRRSGRLVWKQSRQWESVEAYVADHYAHDGSELVATCDGTRDRAGYRSRSWRNWARWLRTAVEPHSYIKYCPTPEGRGAHMVVSSDQGPMTVIFMPETQVTDGEMVEFDQMHAHAG